NFKLQEAPFFVKGYAGLSDTTSVNFYVKGEKQDFNLLTAFLPTSVKETLKPFQYNGKLHFSALINGKITKESLPLIEVSFGCEEAWFLNTGANKKLDRLAFEGYYTNGSERSLKTSELHMLNVTARPEKGVFKGNFVVRDFTDPKALVQINSQLELKFLGEFLGINDLKQTTGTIKLEMDFKEIHNITLPEASLNKLKEGVQSKLIVENLSFRIPGYPNAVTNMNVKAEMIDGKVTVDSATLSIGDSDLEFSGSISDVRAFLRDRDKSINLTLNVGSKQLMLSDLLSYDTTLARKWNEEVHGFSINLALGTTVEQLIHPSPLPKGTFEIKHLRGSFKNYAHTFKDIGATVMINDTLLRLRDFTGMIDSSDINFKGRIVNYHLWFDKIKKGKTQIAFDFKSNRFAFKDVFSREVRQFLPRGYRREELNNVWLRAKVDMRYDTIFRFAKARITNVSADLKKHNLKVHEISGGVKYGSKLLSLDTLKGKIGNSDFDISLKYYFKGIDRNNNKVANSLTFASKLLDADEISHYDLAPKQGRSRRDSTGKMVAVKVDSSQHAQAFNIFMIPFSDFNAKIDIGKVKYNRLWLKDVNAKLTMLQDHTITVDTLTMKVAGGAVAMRGKFNGSNPEKIYFRSRINFDQVDLEKMLLKLDHFGQDVVVNKNIKGRLSGQVKSYIQVHPNLVPILSNIKAEMTLNIYNGSLVNFAPMQAMASYFKDKNLHQILFDTLQNKITFTNGVLDIPEMDINSSLGYIQLSGKQSLDLSMEYYIRVPMKMVTKVGFSALFNRKPEEVDMNQVDQVEYIDKDKKIAFMNLKVTGTPDGNVEVGLGKQSKRKKLF
ncbi:MAG TPA: AsmA-like C-terminal region-containing protein, partial [Cyclobacteriaceae bacterium]